MGVVCAGSLFLGWVSGESWMRPATELEDLDGADVLDGLERVLLGIPRDYVAGAAQESVVADGEGSQRDDPRR